MISETTYNELLRKWRYARLNRDQGLLDYPSINILHPEHGVGGEEPDDDIDIDTFQGCVDRLPKEIKSVFEAFHLGIIRGEYCRHMPHKVRWLILGIDGKTYKSRQLTAREAIRKNLLNFFENMVS